MGLGDIAGSLLDAVTGGNYKRAFIEDDQGTKVILDVTSDLQRDSNTTVSRHAIEAAEGEISDNAKNDPRTITAKVVMSNYTGMSALNPASYGRLLKSTFGKTENTINPRMEIVKKWRDKKTLLTFRHPKMFLKNCIVQKLTESIGEATGDGLGLSIAITEVFIANSETVTIELKKPAGARKTTAKKSSAAKKLSKLFGS